MKASIKFREEKNPLVRAKVPINVLGLPFFSGFAVGDATELRLDLATAFDSGPSLRVSYRPNDPWRPFSLVLKTGVGPSATDCMAMTAEFNPLGRGAAGPSFSILFKPQSGDFAIKNSVRSTTSSPVALGERIAVDPRTADGEGVSNGVEAPVVEFLSFENAIGSGKKANGEFLADARRGGVGGFGRLFSGMEVMARSVLPLRSHTALKFRWGLRVPPELRSALTDDGKRAPVTGMLLGKLPLLVLNKISFEHAMANNGKEKEKAKASATDTAASDDVPEAVKRQLGVLQAEHWSLRQSVEELRAAFIDWQMAPVVAGRVSSIADVGGEGGVPLPSSAAVSGNQDRQSNENSPENSGKVVGPEVARDEGSRNAK